MRTGSSSLAGRAARAVRPASVAAERLFFPAAATYGAVVVPLSVHGMLSGNALLPGLAGITGHAHELLFGYALAVVAGFLVTRTTQARLGWLFGAWVAARAAFLALPGSAWSLAADIAFAALLALLAAPQFLKGAKKLRNKAFAPLLIALCLAVPAFQLGLLTGRHWLQFLALQEAVLLFALLMLFMGGRIIAPAAAGAIQRAGGHLEARVQPRIEAALLVVMALAAVALAVPGGRAAAGGLLLAAALLALLRLARWRLWACAGRPDLWCLGVGYLWLVIGLALLGLSWSVQLLPAGSATHAVTLGALGTLTTAVMARVRLARNRRDPAEMRTLPWITAAIALATLLRLFGSGHPATLAVAAALWSLALTILLVTLLRVPAR
jgi:uncharacterized protein involved in response to NO